MGAKRKILVADRAQIAWAAGIIEGEGSIQAAIRSKRDTLGGPLIYVRVRVVMTDRDILERLHDLFGGTDVLAYQNVQGLGKKQLFRWEVSDRQTVKQTCDAIYPWMGERRRAQIDRLRATVAEHPPISNQERCRRTWATRHAHRGHA